MLTERVVRDAKGPRTIWDGHGFGLQVSRGGHKSYVQRFKDRGGKWRQTIIGSAADLSLKEARDRGAQERASIEAGGADPFARREAEASAPTVAVLVARFFAETAPRKRALGKMSRKTVENYRSQANRYVLPVLGTYKVADVRRPDVDRMLGTVDGTGPARNRVLQFASRLFTEAERWELRPEHSNPCRLIERAVEKPRNRVLSRPELMALGEVLDGMEAAGESPSPINAVRVAVLTGWRIGEVLGLRWDRLNLAAGQAEIDGKTGAKAIPLARGARAVLGQISPVNGNPWVFPGAYAGSAVTYKTTRGVFKRACREAGIKDARIHDLRRTFATTLAAAGIGAFTLRDALGHRSVTMSARYVQMAGEALADALEHGPTLGS